jgi:hypothetical protein
MELNYSSDPKRIYASTFPIVLLFQQRFCPDSSSGEVIFYTIKEGGHEWFQMVKPIQGQDILAIDSI